MSWDEASALIADGSLTSLAKLGRVPSDTRKYRKFRSEHILATYASVTDYLYASVFNIECKTKGRYSCLNICICRKCGCGVDSKRIIVMLLLKLLFSSTNFADGKLVAVVPDDFRTKERIVWRKNASSKQKELPQLSTPPKYFNNSFFSLAGFSLRF